MFVSLHFEWLAEMRSVMRGAGLRQALLPGIPALERRFVAFCCCGLWEKGFQISITHVRRRRGLDQTSIGSGLFFVSVNKKILNDKLLRQPSGYLQRGTNNFYALLPPAALITRLFFSRVEKNKVKMGEADCAQGVEVSRKKGREKREERRSFPEKRKGPEEKSIKKS